MKGFHISSLTTAGWYYFFRPKKKSQKKNLTVFKIWDNKLVRKNNRFLENVLTVEQIVTTNYMCIKISLLLALSFPATSPMQTSASSRGIELQNNIDM